MHPSQKACPFVARECLRDGCLAWMKDECRLIPTTEGSSFQKKLEQATPFMYRSLLDLVNIMENASRDCSRCGPEMWNYAQEVRAGLLDELIKAELAEVGVKANGVES